MNINSHKWFTYYIEIQNIIFTNYFKFRKEKYNIIILQGSNATRQCGPMSVSLGGHKYFMLVNDDNTDYRYVFFLKTKNEAFHHFKKVYNLGLNILKTKCKMMRCDNGTEWN